MIVPHAHTHARQEFTGSQERARIYMYLVAENRSPQRHPTPQTIFVCHSTMDLSVQRWGFFDINIC